MMTEILIGKSYYNITCEESEKEKLIQLTTKLNKRLESISTQMKITDEKTLLAMASLMIEEELEHHNNGTHEHHELNKLNDQDVYDAVSENIENISDYIEKLTKKIQNY